MRLDNEWGDIKYQDTNNANQSLVLKFRKWSYIYSHKQEYWISFIVTGKRGKINWDNNYCKQTGNDGLHSLLWAKGCIKDFIKTCTKNCTILIEADDSNRFRVYKRGLRDLGFTETRYSQSGCSLRVLKLDVIK